MGKQVMSVQIDTKPITKVELERIVNTIKLPQVIFCTSLPEKGIIDTIYIVTI